LLFTDFFFFDTFSLLFCGLLGASLLLLFPFLLLLPLRLPRLLLRNVQSCGFLVLRWARIFE
jgi:hypothetical protein